MASKIPCPPEVPGNQLAITAVDWFSILSIKTGLPERRTLTKGIFWSIYLTVEITSDSKLSIYKANVFFWVNGAYIFGWYKHPRSSANLQ